MMYIISLWLLIRNKFDADYLKKFYSSLFKIKMKQNGKVLVIILKNFLEKIWKVNKLHTFISDFYLQETYYILIFFSQKDIHYFLYCFIEEKKPLLLFLIGKTIKNYFFLIRQTIKNDLLSKSFVKNKIKCKRDCDFKTIPLI